MIRLVNYEAKPKINTEIHQKSKTQNLTQNKQKSYNYVLLEDG